MLDNIKVDHGNIGKYLKDKSPYIFVDVADVKPGVSARGKKLFATNEWFFACHFPNNPLVPCRLSVRSYNADCGFVYLHN